VWFLLLPIVVVGFITSLVPFMYPDTLLNFLGVHLNSFLGEALAGLLPATRSILVSAAAGGSGLTLPGVFALYGPALILVLVGLRSR
jgi:hypothetical protein